MAQSQPSSASSTARLLIIAYVVCLVVDVIAILTSITELRYFSKCLLILFLLLYFAISVSRYPSPLKKWIILALIFSWCGDVLLLFEPLKSIFFIFGLSAFLIAHIFYIIFFHQLRVIESIPPKPVMLVIVAAYYLLLIQLLGPHLGNLSIPVRVYAVVICFMWMLALHILYISSKPIGRILAGGAVLFVISDSLLAIDKFYQQFTLAGPLIMTTYATAQFALVYGAIRYVRSKYLSSSK